MEWFKLLCTAIQAKKQYAIITVVIASILAVGGYFYITINCNCNDKINVESNDPWKAAREKVREGKFIPSSPQSF